MSQTKASDGEGTTLIRELVLPDSTSFRFEVPHQSPLVLRFTDQETCPNGGVWGLGKGRKNKEGKSSLQHCPTPPSSAYPPGMECPVQQDVLVMQLRLKLLLPLCTPKSQALWREEEVS